MGKTIRDIANELGVSKQAVFKKVDKLGLRQQLTKVDNQFTVDENQEKLIKYEFEKKNATQKASTTPSTETTTETTTSLHQVDTLIDMLREELANKNRELEIKNKQIADLNERLAESQRLIDQQQKLHAVTEQKLLALEEAPKEEKRHWWQPKKKTEKTD